MEGLQAPWRFELRTDVISFVGCSAVFFIASAMVVYTVRVDAFRASSTQALQTKVERGQEYKQPPPARDAVAASQSEQPSREEEWYGQDDSDDMHKSLRSTVYGALLAPCSCVMMVQVRVPRTRSITECLMFLWMIGVVPCMLVAQLLVVGLCATGIAESDSTAAWITFAPILVLTVTMMRPGFMLSNDEEFGNIDDFEAHRTVKLFTRDNILKLGSIIYVFFANIGVATSLMPKVEETSEGLTHYEKIRKHISRIFGMAGFVNIRMGALSDAVSFIIVFVTSVCVVLVWVMRYHPMIDRVMGSAQGYRSKLRRKKMYEYRSKLRRKKMYESIGKSSLLRSEFILLSDTLFLPVVTNLLKVFSCTDDANSSRLRYAPDVTCWTIPHTGMAVTASLCLYAYMPTVLFGASFMLADSDGTLTSPSLDLLFESRYLIIEKFMKILLSISCVFVGPWSAPWSLTVQFVINLFMAVATVRIKPCSVLWVNYLTAAAFSCTTLASIVVFYDVSTDMQWWPLLFFLLGFLVIVAVLFRIVVMLRRIGGSPSFVRSKILRDWHPHTVEFDDANKLRGHILRLRQITFWSWGRDNYLTGVQCVFEVDGVVVPGRPHVADDSLLECVDGFKKQHLLLEPGEEILEARGSKGYRGTTLKLLLRTSKKEIRFGFGDGEDPIEEMYEFKQEPDKVVVGLFGGYSTGLEGFVHNLGFISVTRPPAPKRRCCTRNSSTDCTEDGALGTEAPDSSEGLADETGRSEGQDGSKGASCTVEAVTIGIPTCAEDAPEEHTEDPKPRKKKKKQISDAVATPSTPEKKRVKKRSTKNLGSESATTQEQGERGECSVVSRNLQPADTPEV